MNYDLDTKEGMDNAVRWTEKLFDVMNDGATWAVPRSSTLVLIDKQTKTATIREGFLPEKGIAKVIRAMGWTVIVE